MSGGLERSGPNEGGMPGGFGRTASRFLDALEARHERTQRQLTDAISFASYRKEANV